MVYQWSRNRGGGDAGEAVAPKKYCKHNYYTASIYNHSYHSDVINSNEFNYCCISSCIGKGEVQK